MIPDVGSHTLLYAFLFLNFELQAWISLLYSEKNYTILKTFNSEHMTALKIKM